MSFTLGIRREDKNIWEKRVPIVPDHVKELKEKHGINTIIQPSKIRIFDDESYQKVKAIVNENLKDSNVVFAIKEIPIDFFEKDKTYVFFSHVIKGQKKNMPMLKKMIQNRCTLIDYEKITNTKNRRLVFFGRYAGLAGMIDTLWGLGQHFRWRRVETPFNEIKQTIDYNNLNEIKKHLQKLGKKIQNEGIPDYITPFIVGFVGYGNVSKGAQEILDLLPVEEITPIQLKTNHYDHSNNVIYKVLFKEEDIVEHISNKTTFNLMEYYNKPHLYTGIFHQYIKKLTIIMNCIYWHERYPRLITKQFLKNNYTNEMKLQAIGDISVDINGAIEFTEKITTPGNPVFVYDPIKQEIIDGYRGNGIIVMSVDNLPCELPLESSNAFSNSLIKFVPSIVKADYKSNFEKLEIPEEIKKAIILYRGKLTPNYQYINKYL
jgi:alpha-aminoadipic semialdehyde synthase